MAVDKFSVSLPGSLTRDIDEIASSEGLTRSAVIREAAAAYVASRKSADYEQARRERIDEALAGFEEVAAGWGDDRRTSLDYLRELRGDPDEPQPPRRGARK